MLIPLARIVYIDIFCKDHLCRSLLQGSSLQISLSCKDCLCRSLLKGSSFFHLINETLFTDFHYHPQMQIYIHFLTESSCCRIVAIFCQASRNRRPVLLVGTHSIISVRVKEQGRDALINCRQNIIILDGENHQIIYCRAPVVFVQVGSVDPTSRRTDKHAPTPQLV